MEFFLQQVFNGLVQGGVYALFALGFGLVFANMRIFNVAHEAVFAWAALLAYFTIANWGFAPVLGYVLAIAGATIMSGLVYLVLLRHVQGRRESDLFGFVSTLGGLLVLTQLGDIALGGGGISVRLPPDAFPRDAWDLGFLHISSINLVMAVVTIVAFAGLWLMLNRSAVGRQIRTVAYDRELGGLLGINVERVTLTVFLLSGLLAAIAAILFAIAFNVINPQMGASYAVLAFAITVVGGYGNITGTLVSGLLVGLLSSLTGAYVSTAYQQVVVFAAFMLVLIIRPQGLFPAQVVVRD